MGAPAVDFSAILRAIIQAGQTVEQANVVEVVSDTGLVVGHATYEMVQSNNGVAQEVAVATTAGGTGVAATTTGLAYLTFDIGVMGAALAPALGALAGVGLYNLAPEFWTKLSNSLMNAGQTIGGKVIGYWDGDNINFSQETINIFMNALVEANALIPAYNVPDPQTEGEVDIESRVTGTELLAYAMAKNSRQVDISAAYAKIGGFINQYYDDKKLCFIQMTTQSGEWHGFSPITIYISEDDFDSINLDNPIYCHELQTYGDGYEGESIVLTNQTIEARRLIEPFVGDQSTTYTSSSSNINIGENPNANTQPGAIYPDGRPVPYIYPGWLPWEYPVTVPGAEDLPKVYPVKYPGTLPDPNPTQEPAQNPEPEPVPIIIPIITPAFPLPAPNPIETPEIEPDPDPREEPEEDEREDKDKRPKDVPDPVDPNPNPIDTPVIIIPPLPDSVNSNKLFTVYNPTPSQLDQLGGFLWSSSIIENIRKIWQDPLDGIISLIQVYATPVTSGSHNIILGLLDSGVSSSVVSSQFVTIDCGNVEVPENKSNATDYAPYTSLHLFLPFIGIVELDTNECMNATINVKYKVDVYTGTCLAEVRVIRTIDMSHGPILYTYTGNCSQQIPLTSANASGLLSTIMGGVTAGLAVASGGSLGVVAGANLVGNSLTHEMIHVAHSGNISANAGIMGQKKPYLIIGRRHCYDANNYNSYYGYPANKTVILNNCSGYIKVKKCFVKTSATQAEHDLIMEYLENGVIV